MLARGDYTLALGQNSARQQSGGQIFFPFITPSTPIPQKQLQSPSLASTTMRTRGGQYGQQSSSDGFIMVDDMPGLPLRPRSNVGQEKTSIQLHPLAKEDAFIVCVRPPLVPATLERAPCDIVLVIDVSSSMTATAPLPMVQDIDERESTGLSILDLAKHAARTVLERLDEKDRLGIVAFFRDAKIGIFLFPFASPVMLKITRRLCRSSCR
ncbi:hypothetical protein ABEF95_001199 [Exophiala dermatitidis]